MDYLPADLTDDEYERSLLIHEDGPPDPNDPYHVEMHDIAVLLANFRSDLTAAQRRMIPYLHQNLPHKEVAEKAGCTPQTVTNALKNSSVRQCLRLLMQADRLQAGPSVQQRANMLWRIALRTEHDKPTTAIRAVDTLNKLAGDYQPGDEGEGKTVINIREFRIEQKFATPTEKDVTPANNAFKPITVDAKPE
jgi:predicted DNA-binding protein YlxM (UPF0122 family)